MDNEIKFKKPQQPDPSANLQSIITALRSAFNAVIEMHPAVLQHFHFTTPPISYDGDESTTYMVMTEFAKYVVKVRDLLDLVINDADPESVVMYTAVYGNTIELMRLGYATRLFIRVQSPDESLYYNVCLQPAPGYGWYVDDIIKEGESLKFNVQRRCYQNYLATRGQQ